MKILPKMFLETLVQIFNSSERPWQMETAHNGQHLVKQYEKSRYIYRHFSCPIVDKFIIRDLISIIGQYLNIYSFRIHPSVQDMSIIVQVATDIGPVKTCNVAEFSLNNKNIYTQLI